MITNRKKILIGLSIIVIVLVILQIFLLNGSYSHFRSMYDQTGDLQYSEAMDLVRYSMTYNALMIFMFFIVIVGILDIVYYKKKSMDSKPYIKLFVPYAVFLVIINIAFYFLRYVYSDFLYYACNAYMVIMVIISVELRTKINKKIDKQM